VAAELTDFSGTSLMDVAAGRYDPAVLEAFGIGDLAHLLPPLVRSADVCGEVTPGAAKDTGLRAGTPVAGGMFDIDACGLATGLVDERQISMIAGTWSCNQYIATRPVVDDVFMTSCYSIPGYYLMLEGSATSASNLEWFVTEFFGAEKREAARQGRSVYDVTNDLVAATRPDAAPIVFLPFLYGSHASPDAKAALLGLSGWHTRGDVLRAIYEGVAFSHRWHVERLLRFRPRPEEICLTGGAARSPVWVRIFADVFQTPIRLPDGTELGALGAAIAAGVAAGCFKDFREAVGAMVHSLRTQAPDPSTAGVYEAKYERYKRAVAALDPVWRSLS
jgi:L-xylulokinase